jgi:hypothetical protein
LKLFDSLLGRTKPVSANLDALFALPTAAVTLQVSAGLVPTGKGGVCFKPPAGQAFADMQTELEKLLQMPDDADATAGAAAATTTARLHDVTDNYGYRWIVVEGTGLDDVVTRVHMVHSSLKDAGWDQQLLCSVFAFGAYAGDASAPTAADELATSPSVYFVYLAKRGTFYPFAPKGPEQRDTELELSLRATIGSDLPIEQDLTRWFPLWNLPLS